LQAAPVKTALVSGPWVCSPVSRAGGTGGKVVVTGARNG
jgi:hypothetical protein